MTTNLRLFTGVAIVLLAAGTAHAQSAPTCSFDAGTATLTITVDGQTATVTRTAPGQIRLNGLDCAGATTTTTDTIVFNGGALADFVVMSGDYAPGKTAEGVGTSEIEMAFNLAGGADNVKITFSGVPATVTFTAGGIDVGNDGDEDITTAGVEKVRPYTKTGADTIDATAYTGGGTLYIWAGSGDDTVYGSAQGDWIYGQDGNDTMVGGAGNDKFYGGFGNDAYYGDDGNDTFNQEATVDGADQFFGGTGIDTVTYAKRTGDVTVTIDGLSNDGASGELDLVDIDVEKVMGGSGNDTLVGSSAVNTLTGNGGADDLYGAGGNDTLQGGDGPDLLVGDAGNDKLYGGNGNDSLDGGAGNDKFFGEAGDDSFINADGVGETVDCGAGAADDPEPEGLDTFVGCELI